MENKERLVRMFDNWCDRGCNLDSTDFINRMWSVGQEAYPQFKEHQFNLMRLEEMIEMAEEETA